LHLPGNPTLARAVAISQGDETGGDDVDLFPVKRPTKSRISASTTRS